MAITTVNCPKVLPLPRVSKPATAVPVPSPEPSVPNTPKTGQIWPR